MNGDGPFGVPRPDGERNQIMCFKERIFRRNTIRAVIADKGKPSDAFLLISESLDDYLEHQIETDKVIVGILKDIQGSIASVAESKSQ